jgi:serine/threonine protein kinase
MQHLARGGFGDIYVLDEHRVIKRVKQQADSHLEMLTLNRVSHPNVIKLLDVTTYDGLHDMVFQRYTMDLKHALKHDLVENKVDVLRQVARGLHAIHQAGVMHRDLRAVNIFIGSAGDVVIGDFGWAQRIVKGRRNTLPESTLEHYAPEIVNDDPFYTSKVDIFAFGVMMFRMFHKARMLSDCASNHVASLRKFYKARESEDTLRAEYGEWEMNRPLTSLWLVCTSKNPRQRRSTTHLVEILTNA